MTPEPLPVPPPVVALAAGIVQRLVTRGRPSTTVSRTAAGLVVVGSLAVAGGAAAQFARERTTVDPHAPERATSLVTTGPNTFTRNPMYVGMAGVLIAHAVLRRSLPALLPAAAFVAVIDRVQVPAEEAALQATFGALYDDYRERVPRWLGR